MASLIIGDAKRKSGLEVLATMLARFVRWVVMVFFVAGVVGVDGRGEEGRIVGLRVLEELQVAGMSGLTSPGSWLAISSWTDPQQDGEREVMQLTIGSANINIIGVEGVLVPLGNSKGLQSSSVQVYCNSVFRELLSWQVKAIELVMQ